MNLTIDNLDGLGAVDYTAALDRSAPFEIERTLNAPSLAHGALCLAGASLLTPVRRARVSISAHTGLLLFTGYLSTEPTAIYAGVNSQGPVYRLLFNAVSDEWLLDKQAWGSESGPALANSSASVLETLVARLASGLLGTSGLAAGALLGVFEPPAGSTWSGQAGAAAAATCSAYRALNAALTLTPAASVVHAFSDGDGSLSVGQLQTSALRELANDVTVSGAMEPTAYWTELFSGDGVTTEFYLNGQPDANSAGKLSLVVDSFNQSALNLQTWMLTDPGSHLSPGGGGLTMTGGNGFDGQTTLTAWNPIELGGTIVIELDGVTLTGASAGVLGGLYQGVTEQANCFAGFNVSQAGGATVVSPMVNGAQVGTPYTLLGGHVYTLHIRLHCPEMLRVKQQYYAMAGGSVESFGGGLVTAPASIVFDLRDNGASSNTPVTVLYDGTVTASPARCGFVAVNSVQLFGSIASVEVKRTGSAWVQTIDPIAGAASTRLIGEEQSGMDCAVTSTATGKVTFWPGRVPVAGETIAVSYRGSQRAVGRVADAASIATEAAGGAVGTARWVGHVVRPVARSTEDCENAAEAILSFSTSRAAALTGSYVTVNPAANGVATRDIWPGDTLALTTNGSSTSVIVRRVLVNDQGASPETLTYKIAFANDWAEGLGLQLSEAIAVDALLPATAQSFAPATPWPVLANLQQMTVVASASALTVDAGTAPPAGGGFEVRRWDGGFGVGTSGTASGDLVLRSLVRGFTIPRAAVQERFFVRMYDASTPPLYSRESSAIATDLPLS